MEAVSSAVTGAMLPSGRGRSDTKALSAPVAARTSPKHQRTKSKKWEPRLNSTPPPCSSWANQSWGGVAGSRRIGAVQT